MSARLRTVFEHIAMVLLGIGGPFAYAMASPVYSSGDEAAHVDYALQVWHGHLPVFEDGLELDNTVGARPPVQWTSHHPPLLYLLIAPVVGPLVDAGAVNDAGMGARMVVVALSIALLYAVRALARALMPTVAGVGLASAMVVGLSVWFIRLGGSVYTDTLSALVSALAFLSLVRLARSAFATRDIVLFAVACAACGLTRFSLLPVVALFCVAAVLIGHVDGSPRARRGWIAAAAAAASVAASSLWFYARNIALTGNPSGGHPEWAAAHTSRVARPMLDVASDPAFWTTMTQQFSTGTYRQLPHALESSWPWTIVLLIVPTALGVVMHVVDIMRSREHRAARAILVGSLLCACGGIAVMQIMHTAGGGSAFARYFFAMLPFLAPFLVRPLLTWWAVPLMVWTIARCTLMWLEFEATLARELRPPQAPIYPVPTWWGVVVAFAGALAALVIVVASRRRPVTVRPGARHDGYDTIVG